MSPIRQRDFTLLFHYLEPQPAREETLHGRLRIGGRLTPFNRYSFDHSQRIPNQVGDEATETQGT